MKKTIKYVCCLSIFYFLIACQQPTTQTEKTDFRPNHIFIVGFDGFSAYSLNNGAEMPTLRKLMAEGSYTTENRSVLPSSSAVNWASMFMGAGPELHGYTTWGSQEPDLPPRVTVENNRFPDIFGLYKKQYPEAEIGYIYEWGGLKYLADTLAMDFCQQVAMNDENPEGCTPVAVEYIKKMKPNLCAVLFDKPDGTGHAHGWESAEYFAMLTHLDTCLHKIVEAVKEAGILDESVIMVVSDHGGINKGHGEKTMKEMQTPLVFYGNGIKKGHYIQESTMMYDIAGTIAYMSGIQQPQVWIARPIVSIFE